MCAGAAPGDAPQVDADAPVTEAISLISGGAQVLSVRENGVEIGVIGAGEVVAALDG